MPFDCLVCGRPTDSTHLGLDACRACSVFYRRNCDEPHKLRCKNNANNRPSVEGVRKRCNPAYCRKCRFIRFDELVKAANGEGKYVNACSNFQLSTEYEQGVQNFSIARHLTPGNSIIESIQARYQSLSNYRRTSELCLRGILVSPNGRAEKNEEIIPGTYRIMNEGTKVLIIGLFKFIRTTFPEFSFLPNSEKWLLIRNYEKIFHFIDSKVRTVRSFKVDNSFGFFTSYTTYLSSEHIDTFFLDCPDKKNVTAAAKALRAWYDRIVPMSKLLLRNIEATETEFLALIGLSFWSIETFDASDRLLALATRYRTKIISELIAHYRETIGMERAASRVGSLLCLLQELRRLEMTQHSDFEIFRLLGAFDDNTLTYRLQVAMMRPDKEW